MLDLLHDSDKPDWFDYPPAFRRIVHQNLVDFSPWYLMDKTQVMERMKGLSERYPNRHLVPFARREDNDDVACFEKGRTDSVVIIHDFASCGSEQRAVFPSFWDWLKAAIEDMIAFEP